MVRTPIEQAMLEKLLALRHPSDYETTVSYVKHYGGIAAIELYNDLMNLLGAENRIKLTFDELSELLPDDTTQAGLAILVVDAFLLEMRPFFCFGYIITKQGPLLHLMTKI